MQKYNSIWEKIVCKIFPKYRSLKEETKEIKMKTWNLKKISYSKEMPINQKLSELQKGRDEIFDSIIKRNSIKEEQLRTNVEFDYDFLKNSVKSWDKLDYVFVFFIVAVYITLMDISKGIIDNGKETHDNHSVKATAARTKEFGINKIHKKMPNDKIPGGHYGIENPNGRFIINAKINDIGLNHRFIFGHDLLKPFQVLKDLNQISDVTPILGSKKLGALIKQFYHIFYDTFSETGIPAPGSTYFLDFITKHIINSNDDFIKYFSVHIEDIITSSGIEGCIYIYHRFRQYKENDEALSFFDVVKDLTTIDLGKRSFKEYEMDLIAHSLIIWLQLNIPSNFRGKVNYNSIRYFAKDTIQYVRLNHKWNKNYKNMIISELQEITRFEVPEELKPRFQELCLHNNISYSDDFYEIYDNISKKLAVLF